MEQIYKPSLQEGIDSPMESYDFRKLFVVALFCGMIPTTVLSYKNALSLKMDKMWAHMIAVLGSMVVIVKWILVGYIWSGTFEMELSDLKIILRIVALATFLIFTKIMSANYKKFRFVDSIYKPLLKDAFKWTVLGIFVEFFILVVIRATLNV